MVQKIQMSDFSRREIPLEPFLDFEVIDEENQKTLSHLLGWSDTEKKWLMVRVDSAGRLKTAIPGLATKHKYNVISVSDTEVTTDLMEKYMTHLIINDGPNSVYINFDDTATTSSIEIKAGEMLTIDYEFQVLHAICASGETATIRWIALR